MSGLKNMTQADTVDKRIVGTCGNCLGAMMLAKLPTDGDPNSCVQAVCVRCGRVQKPAIGSQGRWGVVMDVSAP